MIKAATLTAAYRPRPPRNARARIATALFALVVSSLLWGRYWDGNCIELVVASSNEKADQLSEIATEYDAPRVNQRCVNVTILRKPSGTAEDALARDWRGETDPRPHVWSPAATSWLLLLSAHRGEGAGGLVPSVASPLIQSPLVVAMPKPMADTLLQTRDRVGWHDIATLTRDPQGWTRFGMPWGRFRLGKTTPLISTSGLHALIGLDYAAQAEEEEPVAFLQGVDSSVAHYADSVATFLENLRLADRDGRALQYVSAIAVEEKQVHDYNLGLVRPDPCDGCPERPHTPLRSIYPKEGTLYADHPYAVLNWPDMTDAHRKAAADFRTHLESDPIQKRFQDAGFRDNRRQAGENLSPPYFERLQPRALYDPPTPQALLAMRDLWSEHIRKRANAIVVLDVGTAGGEYADTADGSKLTLVSRAFESAMDELAESDVIGLHTFPHSGDGPSREVRAPQTIGPPGTFLKHLRELTIVPGRRSLHGAVRLAADRVRARFDPARVNAVIVLSDAPPEADAASDLLASLRQHRDGQNVLVLTIGLSKRAEADLIRIAQASGGAHYDATDPRKLNESVRNAVANL